MRIDYQGVQFLPQGVTHIYTAILHPDIQKEIKSYNDGAKNVYLKDIMVYIPRPNLTYHCLKLVTF